MNRFFDWADTFGLRALANDSAACAAASSAARRLLSGVRAVRRAGRTLDSTVSPDQADREFAVVLILAKRSLLFRALERCLSIGSIILGHSAVGSALSSAAGRMMELEAWQRVRLAGLVFLVAAATHWLLTVSLPASSVPLVPPIVWGVLFVLGLVMVLASKAVTAAWTRR